MTTAPDISVVMGVYNGGSSLPVTIESVLSQEGASFEFIIINDGSSDDSGQILENYATRDSRIRIIQQENRGLTKALIKGCAEAQGKYIARQDVGDVSLPNRLAMQFDLIDSNLEACFVSSGTRFVGPEHEQLYEVLPEATDLTAELLTLRLDEIKGPSMHGCTMFRRDKYFQVGGYREAFYFAQDLDLWVRLAEIGKHLAIPEVLYEASLTLGSITGSYRKQQVDTARLILESARRRRRGEDDRDALQRAAEIKPNATKKSGRFERANTLYFIGACLRQQRSPDATHYFQRALLTHPLHLKSALRLITG